MKILITGTHFTPAQAVIEELKKDDSVEIVYVGRKTTIEGDKTPSVESRILPELGVKFIPLTAGRIRRFFSFWTIISFLKIPLGFIQSFNILVSEKPDVVLSFGGYIGLPVVFNAWLLNIPIILHEQTLVSGLSNKMSSLFADKVAVSFEKKYEFSKKKIIFTGNPIRTELLKYNDKNFQSRKNVTSQKIKEFVYNSKNSSSPLVLVTGGNQGSHIINETVEKSLDEFLKLGVLVHQTGDSSFKDYERLKEKQNERYLVEKWIDGNDFGFLISNTDLVISRAGANTLTELAYFGVPALVIPIPYVNKNEQEKNADFFEDLGLVKKLLQKGLTSEKLLKTVKTAISELKSLKEKSKNAKKVVIEDAARRVALETKILGEHEY
ncbi:MAG: hypothetical protein ACD_31C00002G0022 [uncultured bacterium]|uniref:UDP-N-acetylglucosamine--N-acetylmuramyl-(pentapeptide) pyrophosphoryl-undecaprenol N-acetylglucosamine transferase n=4 Tax=Candidatus Daviesiibacteriota TaxID=1752718 RepID=A0A0G0HTV0_9BACT|nr:MAG: hypothetical protein ACD_31C00002G0022 [uncultured bacterium]KKQ07306.1 MAG: hypothetical protein US19_C0050G0006 [Candidatus Daviesbacteria bacterium GW2011_GWB1_36_5]KKQ15649.1 MAG: hypothetical protein US28_C0013G0028 [Candidatus Daviesbacteria bacterium GW2011_GWA1_36_8]OGE17493.1 MAG: hypothetical protein A2858_01130 [Candidatus Daviesbacteria bacterium RIFCSPHIGHO2_01_FULL_36_37]OGE36588.1 MAG: hypothetical protein A3E66_02975 [Candidatus Daviesbacteria bacterium RIFCSPHIGHO2_12_F